MAKQLMIYERAVPISSEKHRDWSVKTGGSYDFAREINSVPVVAAEFSAAAVEYAIVFAGDGDAVFPSVILGMKDGENGFVAEDGKWDGTYVPAFLRRYPFVFSRSENGETFTLCIDEEFEGLNDEGKGERLFDADGSRTQYLDTMLRFTQEYQAQFTRTQVFARKLNDLGLLEPAQAQFQVGDKQSAMAGFKTVNRQKLKELPAETLKEMAMTDELELCYLHLQSLNNLAPMARKIAAREAA
ncbi:MAG: SapC family protein [Rubricella sp.]